MTAQSPPAESASAHRDRYRPRTSLVMAPSVFQQQFGGAEWERLTSLADLTQRRPLTGFEGLELEPLQQSEVLITSWGCPPITTEVLDQAPRLRAILHAAGSVRAFVAPDAWQRGIQVVSSADLNSIPVAEYTLAAIIMAGKRLLPAAQELRTRPRTWHQPRDTSRLSNRGRTIGLIGFSRIGRRVIELLRVLETGAILVCDPHANPDEVDALGAELVSLREILRRSEILSVHAPLLESTRGMLGSEQLAWMPDGAVLINTARGGLVDQDALIEQCARGRLDAVLDVTDPEELPVGHPLLTLPNVVVTPHLAGATGSETIRLSHNVLDALEAWIARRDLPGLVRFEQLDSSA